MNVFIIDASVGVKWLFKEEMWERAIIFMNRLTQREITIVVPEIFYSELASACWKRVRKRIISMGDAIQAVDNIMNLPLKRYSDWELADVALENSLRFKTSVYDSLYLALAEIYLAPLITADEVLYNACRDRFDFIELLKDVSPH